MLSDSASSIMILVVYWGFIFLGILCRKFCHLKIMAIFVLLSNESLRNSCHLFMTTIVRHRVPYLST